MKTFMTILLIFGLFEILSNLLHLSKGSKEKIGESARRQHQELPLNTGLYHFYYKAILMFTIGVLFLVSSLVYFLYDSSTGVSVTFMSSVVLSLYGFIQIIIYYRTIKVWTSFVVYSIPLIVFYILS